MRSHETTPSDTRALILQAARDRFAQYGFAKATMDEIAEAAGMAKASLYYYFPTKEELFQAVVFQEHEAFAERAERIISSDHPVADKIRAYVRERSEHFDALFHLNILELRSSAPLKPLIRDMFRQFADRELGFVRRIIQEGKLAGCFAIPSASTAAAAFLHVMQGLRLRFLREVKDGGGKLSPTTLKHEMEFVTEVFLRGISAASDPECRAAEPSASRM